ncbi:hypothetical protein IMPR6_50087 [Imperialibacter sp. EC-SDR9]|nr:hypothetical protein IMPERIA89_50201 [Imperialibacter sp. 89]CAD5286438.1 hypothetical protein IMPERIA75_600087 [Imperialibacter sp. 75]VVT29978.1 hypothetical protein IMPR6_50087 [Imperialibacter sp. EC-SDR9]
MGVESAITLWWIIKVNAKLTAMAGGVVAQVQLLVTYITDGTPWVERGELDVKWSAHSREFGGEVSQPIERVRNSAMSHTQVEITSGLHCRWRYHG